MEKANELERITNLVNSMVKTGIWEVERLDINTNIVGSYCAVVWVKGDLKFRIWGNGIFEKAD